MVTIQSNHSIATLILMVCPFAMMVTFIVSVLYGAKSIDPETVWHAFFQFDEGNVDHQIVIHSRVPRAIGTVLIGTFLAISGAIMQGMTRNYLASPSIMGVSDGSVFAITLCMVFAPHLSSVSMIVFSLIGSAFAVVVVFGLASLLPSGFSPVRMAVLGTVIGTFLSSTAAALSSYFHVSQNISFWYHARLHQLNPDFIKLTIPFAMIGLILAMVTAKSITVLSLGEEVSVGLGQSVMLVKLVATTCVVILTGISVALAGSIGFVGLIVPHIARFLVGMDYRWSVPCAGLLGGLFLLLCDLVSRFLNYPYETPIGVVTALIGVPFFLYLIRKKGGENRD